MKSLLILLAGVFAVSATAGAQALIGVVDVERCLKEYKKADEQRLQLTSELEAKARALTEEKRKINALRENLDFFTEGSKEWLEQIKKIKLGAAQIEFDQEAIKVETQQKLAELIAKLYEDVRREIKLVAEAKGMKLVLMQISSMPKGRTDSEVTNNIMVRPVVYFDPNMDITAEVVKNLNK
jgi:Skp family chaperone for outer membrane proteins